MFKEFNVQFQDAQIVGGADNLLENTKVTKVVLRGDNNLSSLDSTFKNCSELDIIDGAIKLDGISDIDNLLDETPLVKEVTLENINTEISAKDSFNDVDTINIDGNCTKEGIQSFLSNFEWNSRKHKYVGEMENTAQVLTEELNGYEDREIIIDNSTEYSAKGVEIYGQTYQNLVDGKNENIVKNEWTLNVNDGSGSKDLVMDNTADLAEIQGQTYQNLISNAREEKDLVDPFEFTATSNSDGFNGGFDVFVNEIQGNTVQDTSDYSVSNIGDELFNLAKVGEFNSTTSTGITFSSDENMNISITATSATGSGWVDIENGQTATGAAGFDSSYIQSRKIVDQPGTYTISLTKGETKGSVFAVVFYDDTGVAEMEVKSVITITVSKRINFIAIRTRYSGEISSTFSCIQLEKGSTATQYIPYGNYKLEIECANKNFADINKPSGYVNTDTHTYSDGVVTISCKQNNQVHAFYTFNLNIPKGQSYSVQAQVVSSYGGEDGTTDLGLSSCTIEIWEDDVWVPKRWSSNSSGFVSATRTVSKDISEVKFRIGTADSYFKKKTFSFKDLQFELGTKTSYENRTTNKITFALPHPLRKVKNYADRLYWDEDKGHYCIERKIQNAIIEKFTDSLGTLYINPVVSNANGIDYDRCYGGNNYITSKIPACGWNGSPSKTNYGIGIYSNGTIRCYTNRDYTTGSLEEVNSIIGDGIDFLATLTSPEIIDLPQYNEKKFLTTYDTSYICVSNGTVNSNYINVSTDILKKEALVLPSTKYSLMMECDRNSAENGITYDLCGTTGTINSTDGYKYMITSITTPSTLSHNTLKLSGLGNKVKNVMLLKDTMSNEIGYFEGIQSFGELQDDGRYKVEVIYDNIVKQSISPSYYYNYAEKISLNGINFLCFETSTAYELKKSITYIRAKIDLSKSQRGFLCVFNQGGERSLLLEEDNRLMLKWNCNGSDTITEVHRVISNEYFDIVLKYDGNSINIFINGEFKTSFTHGANQRDICNNIAFNSQYFTGYNYGCGGLTIDKTFVECDTYSKTCCINNEPKFNMKTFYLDEPLRKIDNISDRLYYDYDKGKYCVERNIGILDKSKLNNNGVPQTSDSNYTCRYYSSAYYGDLFNNTKGWVRADGFHPNENFSHLLVNQSIGIMGGALMITLKNSDIDAYGSFGECVRNKPFNIYMVYLNPIIEELEDTNQSINVYTPTTYISTNSVIKPSTLKIESKPITFNVNLVPNAEYTLQFDVDRVTTDNKLTYYLGGTTGNITTENGYNTRRLVVNTPNTIEDNILKFVGEGHTIKNVMLLKDGQVQGLSYFDGVLNLGELQEDGKYKIELKSHNEQNQITSSRILTFNLDEQLYKVDDICDKLYWDETKGHFCIDKKISPNLEALSTPKVIDLVEKNEPIELYPKEITKISCNNEVKPSKIKIKYIDIQ